MHSAAFEYVARQAAIAGNMAGCRVLEIGSYNVNGSVRSLFAGCADYVGIDARPGPDVDIAVAAVDYDGGEGFDVVVCCEVLEHDPRPGAIIECAWRALKPGGMAFFTAAGPGRAPHGVDGMAVQPGEHYANIEPEWLEGVLRMQGWADWLVEENPAAGDVYACARKADDGDLRLLAVSVEAECVS